MLEVGKPAATGYQIKPLDEQGKASVTEQLREFENDRFFEDFRKLYTAEDWAWLKEKLKGKK